VLVSAFGIALTNRRTTRSRFGHHLVTVPLTWLRQVQHRDMKRVLLALAIFVAAGTFVWFSRPTLESLDCRSATAPYQLRHVFPSAEADLARSTELDVGSLRTPSEAEARLQAFEDRPHETYIVCGYGSDRVVVISRAYTQLTRCYGPADACPPTVYGWRTCFFAYDAQSHTRRHPAGCLDDAS
jgi:hypothetical protein